MANNRNNTPNTSPAPDANLEAQLKKQAKELALAEQKIKEMQAELDKKAAELEEKNTAPALAPAPVKEVKKVRITIPITRTEKKDVYVAVNGRTYQIKRGVEVEVPEYVLKVLKHEEKMLMSVANLEEKAAEKAEQ